jgi:hypothetical protein
MALLRRIVKLAGVALALAVYVWFAAVRNVPRVRARKQRRRARRASR